LEILQYLYFFEQYENDCRPAKEEKGTSSQLPTMWTNDLFPTATHELPRERYQRSLQESTWRIKL